MKSISIFALGVILSFNMVVHCIPLEGAALERTKGSVGQLSKPTETEDNSTESTEVVNEPAKNWQQGNRRGPVKIIRVVRQTDNNSSGDRVPDSSFVQTGDNETETGSGIKLSNVPSRNNRVVRQTDNNSSGDRVPDSSFVQTGDNETETGSGIKLSNVPSRNNRVVRQTDGNQGSQSGDFGVNNGKPINNWWTNSTEDNTTATDGSTIINSNSPHIRVTRQSEGTAEKLPSGGSIHNGSWMPKHGNLSQTDIQIGSTDATTDNATEPTTPSNSLSSKENIQQPSSGKQAKSNRIIRQSNFETGSKTINGFENTTDNETESTVPPATTKSIQIVNLNGQNSRNARQANGGGDISVGSFSSSSVANHGRDGFNQTEWGTDTEDHVVE